jgi:hypothetical protein
MKQKQALRALCTLFLSTLLIISCQKTDLSADKAKDPANDASAPIESVTGIPDASTGRILAGGVNLTAPTVVNINESFNILAEISCGRVSLERGFIYAPDNSKIYKNLTCATANLEWEVVVNFQCYTSDLSWNGSLAEVGTYIYRTKHNASDANCDGLGGSNQSGNCSFSGNQVYCFMIEAIDPCQTEFTGEAISCGTSRQAVYTFTSENDESYIKIQGGLTNFTGADAVVTVSGASLTVTQSTPGGSSNRIIKLEGAVTACQEVTITITWNSSNSGGIITGDWSVKNAAGVDLAPAVAGLQCGG